MALTDKPVSDSLPTGSMPEATLLSLEQLQERRKAAELRHKRLSTHALNLSNGFIDGVYDFIALSNVSTAITIVFILGEALLLTVAPPVGLAILGGFLGVAAIYGALHAASVYQEEAEANRKELEEIEKAIAAIQKYDPLVKRLQLPNSPDHQPDNDSPTHQTYLKCKNEIIAQFTNPAERATALAQLDEAYQHIFNAQMKLAEEAAAPAKTEAENSPTSWFQRLRKFFNQPEPIDSADLWSRRARNAFGLGALITIPVVGILGTLLSPLHFMAIAVSGVVQLVLKGLKDRWIDNPRAQNKKEIEQNIARKQRAIEILEAPKNILQFQEQLELATKQIKSQQPYQGDIKFPIAAAQMEKFASTPALSLGEKGEKTGFSPDNSSLSDALTTYQNTNNLTDANGHNKTGLALAGTLGFINGALHPIAWCAIVILSLSMFGITIGTGGVGLGIVIGVGILAAGFGTWIANHAIEKEKDEQRKEQAALQNAIKKAKEAEEKQSAQEPRLMEEQKQQARLVQTYNYCKKNIENKFAPGSDALARALKDLDSKFFELSAKYSELQQDKLSAVVKFGNFLGSLKSIYETVPDIDTLERKTQQLTTPIEKSLQSGWFSTLGRGVAFLSNQFRKVRDHFGAYETTVSAVCLLVAATLSPVILGVTLAVCAISVAIGIYKDVTIDSTRARHMQVYEKTAAALESKSNSLKSELNTLEAKKIALECEFEQEAKTIIINERAAKILEQRPLIARRNSISFPITGEKVPPYPSRTEPVSPRATPIQDVPPYTMPALRPQDTADIDLTDFDENFTLDSGPASAPASPTTSTQRSLTA